MFCEHCEPDGWKDLGCLRGQAEVRNGDNMIAYRKAVMKYDAQMEYYHLLTAEPS